MTDAECRAPHRGLRSKTLLVAIFSFLAIRFATLGSSPLLDPTEGRYAEIAREMLATGDWVTPRIDPDIPFWSKPPLHFWLTASSFWIFGQNEFAARLPGFLSALAALVLAWAAARAAYDRETALWSVLILLSSALFFTTSGYVATDMTLTACVAGAAACFLLAIRPEGKHPFIATCAVAVFLGLGMLAKGPIMLVFSTIPMVLWFVFSADRRRAGAFAWKTGSLIFLCVAAPWYVLAEYRTPGFLNYFFVHEHFYRFFRSDYGDLYGSAHNVPHGTAIGMCALGFLPWTPVFLWAAYRRLKSPLRPASRKSGPALVLIGWAIGPLAFLSLSRNVLTAYVLPAFPGVAILAARAITTAMQDLPAPLAGSRQGGRPRLLILITGLLCIGGGIGALAYLKAAFRLTMPETIPFMLGAALYACLIFVMHKRGSWRLQLAGMAALAPIIVGSFSLFLADDIGQSKSTRDLRTTIASTPELQGKAPVFFDELPFSGEFYFRDLATDLGEEKYRFRELVRSRESNSSVFVIERKDLRKIFPADLALLTRVADSGPYDLYVRAQN